MANRLTQSARQIAHGVFAVWYARTGDYRFACSKAGVSERTGRRWRQRGLPATRSRGNLPRPQNRFVGRSKTLEQIAMAFAEEKGVIELWGAPGIGKTRTALEVAHQIRAEFAPPGGVWWFELSAVSDVREALEALARSFDLSLLEPLNPEALTIALGDRLARAGRILIVLDGIDSIARPLRAAIAQWSTHAPRAQFLCTSRALHSHEAQFELGPLTLPARGESDLKKVQRSEAGALLLERARLAGLAPNAAAITELVLALEGHPLAIELAASSLETQRPSRLLRKHIEAVVVRARQHTKMRRILAASWDLLSDRERRTLAQCSVFHAGFTREAARAGMNRPARESDQLLDGLTTRALLQSTSDSSDTTREKSTRFTMYHSVRELAAQTLVAEGLAAETKRRHAEYFVGLDRPNRHGIHHVRDVASMEGAERERANLVAIVGWATSLPTPETAHLAARAYLTLDKLFITRGPAREQLAMIRECLALPLGESGAHARLLMAEGRARRMRERPHVCEKSFERARGMARALNERRLEGLAVGNLGLMAQLGGRLRRAEVLFREAEEIGVEIGEPRIVGIARINRAHVQLASRAAGVALATARTAFEPVTESGDVHFEGVAFVAYAEILTALQATDEARDALADALDCAKRVGALRLDVLARSARGVLEQECGNLRRARIDHERAVSSARHLGDQRVLGECEARLGHVFLEAGHWDRAADQYRSARRLFTNTGQSLGLATVLPILGAIEARRGQMKKARRLFAKAVQAEEAVERSQACSVIDVWRALFSIPVRDDPSTERARRQRRARAITKLRDLDAATRDELRATRETQRGRFVSPVARLALRLLRGQIPATPVARSGASSAAVAIHADGAAFRVSPHDSVRLTKRPILRALLCALATQYARQPDEGLSTSTLVRTLWPSAREPSESHRSRLYVAIATLRRLGLSDHLISRGRAYRLSGPNIQIRNAASSSNRPEHTT